MARAYSQGGRRTLVLIRDEPSVLDGCVLIVGCIPALCPVCEGDRRVQLRVSAEPPVPRGGVYSCPLCCGGAGPSRSPIPAVQPPWRQEAPRSDVA